MIKKEEDLIIETLKTFHSNIVKDIGEEYDVLLIGIKRHSVRKEYYVIHNLNAALLKPYLTAMAKNTEEDNNEIPPRLT